MRKNFTMGRLPEPHKPCLLAKDDGVIPPPDHSV